MYGVKLLAGAGAAVLLAALAFLHPAPQPAGIDIGAGPRPAHSRAPLGHGSAGALSRAAHHDAGVLVVYVAGEVMHPGLYRVPPGSRANDAVQKAGSFARAADRAAVNLAEVVQDGEEIRVPRTGESVPRARKTARKKNARVRMSVDVNAASAAELAQVPGLGETLAERIVAYRAENGPFASLDELADVSGLTPRRIDALAQYLVVR